MTLDQIARECALPGWGRYGSLPVHPATVKRARKVLAALPADIPEPVVGADPDGCITIEWDSESGMVWASIDGSTQIAHAWLIRGAQRGSDVASLDGDMLPASMLDLIRGLKL